MQLERRVALPTSITGDKILGGINFQEEVQAGDSREEGTGTRVRTHGAQGNPQTPAHFSEVPLPFPHFPGAQKIQNPALDELVPPPTVQPPQYRAFVGHLGPNHKRYLTLSLTF